MFATAAHNWEEVRRWCAPVTLIKILDVSEHPANKLGSSTELVILDISPYFSRSPSVGKRTRKFDGGYTNNGALTFSLIFMPHSINVN